MTKSSENEMVSKSTSKLKMEWMMMSKRERNLFTIEMIVIGYFACWSC